MTPQKYLKIEAYHTAIIRASQKAICHARTTASRCPFPKHNRPAEADDIKNGAVIWYNTKDVNGAFSYYWQVVVEPRHHGSAFKAYVGDDGSMHGLDCAYIDICPPSEFPLVAAVRKALEP